MLLLQKPKTATLLENGCMLVLDEQGHQLPELQLSPIEIWARRAHMLGYKIEGLIFAIGDRQLRLHRTEMGWSWEVGLAQPAPEPPARPARPS